MNEPVAAVEENGQKPEEPTPAEAGDSSASAGRFQYPGGSRPLEGFAIKRGIGHGGFGEVYFATSDAGKEVALKLIRRNLEIELRGIRHCLNLKHPNLLSVFDIREDARGDKWVVMEYVSGESLEDAVAAHPNGLPINDVLNWIHGIGAGVACLHDHGIVHRDLKPGNIFWDKDVVFQDDGLVKIGDYGLSKFISCSRRSGQTESIGTVHYMAPEVANGRYGKEIDVYALGVILYEMLTGRVPFEGESVGEILMKHLTATPDVSMLSEPYRSVVAGALEKDPAKRFGTAAEMLAALPQPDRSGLGATPRPPGGGRPRGRPASNPFAETAPYVAAANEEPIYRAVRQFLGGITQSLRQTWNETNLSGPAKIVVLLLGGIALLVLGSTLLQIAVPLFFVYGVYWVIRTVVLSIQGPLPPVRAVPLSPPPNGRDHRRRPPAGAPLKPPAQCVRPREDLRPRWARHEKAADALVLKPTRERVTELVGSMLGGAVVAVTMCLVMGLVVSLGSPERFSVDHYSQYGWLILMSVIGTWAILVPTKAWEGSRGETRLRRFVLMVFGLVLGLAAAGAAVGLMVDLPHDSDFPSLAMHEITGMQSLNMQAKNALPQMKYYLAAFGLLLLTVRWWRQTDPLRKSRLNLWTMFGCAFMAALIADACGFPQPWLVMFACAVSVSVQLASPWVHPRQRFSRNNFD